MGLGKGDDDRPKQEIKHTEHPVNLKTQPSAQSFNPRGSQRDLLY